MRERWHPVRGCQFPVRNLHTRNDHRFSLSLGPPFPCSCLRVIVKINSLWWNVTRIYLSACDCGERVPAMSNQRDNYEILTHTHGSQMSSLSFPPASSEGRMLPCEVCCQVWMGLSQGLLTNKVFMIKNIRWKYCWFSEVLRLHLLLTCWFWNFRVNLVYYYNSTSGFYCHDQEIVQFYQINTFYFFS